LHQFVADRALGLARGGAGSRFQARPVALAEAQVAARREPHRGDGARARGAPGFAAAAVPGGGGVAVVVAAVAAAVEIASPRIWLIARTVAGTERQSARGDGGARGRRRHRVPLGGQRFDQFQVPGEKEKERKG